MDIKASVRIYENKNIKGFASIAVDEELMITGLKICESKKNELFVAMPQRKMTNGEYQEVVYGLSKKLREQISNVVLNEYERVVNKENEVIQTNQSEEVHEEIDEGLDYESIHKSYIKVFDEMSDPIQEHKSAEQLVKEYREKNGLDTEVMKEYRQKSGLGKDVEEMSDPIQENKSAEQLAKEFKQKNGLAEEIVPEIFGQKMGVEDIKNRIDYYERMWNHRKTFYSYDEKYKSFIECAAKDLAEVSENGYINFDARERVPNPDTKIEEYCKSITENIVLDEIILDQPMDAELAMEM